MADLVDFQRRSKRVGPSVVTITVRDYTRHNFSAIQVSRGLTHSGSPGEFISRNHLTVTNPATNQQTTTKKNRLAVCVIAALLLSQLVAGVLAASRLTVTHDEYWHIPVGLLNWKTGRFDLEPLNPPLLRMWATWPLLFTTAESPRTEPTSDLGRFGDEFLAANPANFDRYVFLARIPIVLLTIAAGALLARWAWEWYGPWGACLVAWLWSRDPNVTAHGSLVTTDAGGAAFWMATLYVGWRFARQPTLRRAIVVGVVLGLAQAAKFTCVLLLPCLVAVWFFERWLRPSTLPIDPNTADTKGTNPTELVSVEKGFCTTSDVTKIASGVVQKPKNHRGKLGGVCVSLDRSGFKHWCVLLLTAALSLNAAYLFRGTGASLKSFEFASQSARTWQQRVGPLASLPVPLPRDFVIGIDRQKAIMEADHPVFLDMEWRTSKFPQYYLMTLVYKLPHSTQVLWLWALIGTVWLRRRETSPTRQRGIASHDSSMPSAAIPRWRVGLVSRQRLMLLLPTILLIGMASTSGMQLGVRYILPALPLLFLGIGEIAADWDWPRFGRQQIAVVALLLVCDPWRVHPEYLAYFNELAGGVEGGRAHLLDSNLDWGQDLHELNHFLHEHPIPSMTLAYFGTMPPEALGIRYTLPPSGTPQPGWHAISVNFVMGRPHGARDGRGGMRQLNIGEFAYFNAFEPKHRCGASLEIYHITDDDVRRWYAASGR